MKFIFTRFGLQIIFPVNRLHSVRAFIELWQWEVVFICFVNMLLMTRSGQSVIVTIDSLTASDVSSSKRHIDRKSMPLQGLKQNRILASRSPDSDEHTTIISLIQLHVFLFAYNNTLVRLGMPSYRFLQRRPFHEEVISLFFHFTRESILI